MYVHNGIKIVGTLGKKRPTVCESFLLFMELSMRYLLVAGNKCETTQNNKIFSLQSKKDHHS